MPTYEVSIKDLRACVDPLNGQTWKCDPIQAAEVIAALQEGDVEERSWNAVKGDLDASLHRAFHVARNAFLAAKPAETDDEHKVIIAIGPDRIWVYDGNHRVAAAIVRGDATMRISIAPYDEAAIFKHLPSAKAL
jgi:hypothetical protein